MKKAAIASLLAVSACMISPGLLSHHNAAFAQQVQMDPAEYADYEAAGKQATPAAQAAAYEAYLQKYPKTAVKADVLSRIMVAYSQADHAKAITAADNVLQNSPSNLQAYLFEVGFRTEAAQAQTDPAAKQAGFDAAAEWAQKGLAVKTPAEGVPAATFAQQEAYAVPYFYGAIGAAANAKKDSSAAVSAYKSELAAYPDAALTTPPVLQEVYYLGVAYYQAVPPDLVNCTFYTTRAAALAPDQYKAQLQPLANYCFKKYHGGMDGYDDVVKVAKANANPPADFKITPAPTPADQVATLLAGTKDEDLPKLALSDKEYILANGKPADADKVFNTIKGKESEIPDTVVIKATSDQLQVAVSDDAVQSKTADFSFNMKEPLKTVPAVGSKITLVGTYGSYTQTPLLIIMSDASVVAKAGPKKPVARTPVRHK